jgi:hypothetical protein
MNPFQKTECVCRGRFVWDILQTTTENGLWFYRSMNIMVHNNRPARFKK